MHSSRMRTGRSLTVCWRMLPRGCLLRGVCSWGGVYSGGVCSGGGGSGLGGLLWGVSAWGVSARGDICSQGVWSGGGSAREGWSAPEGNGGVCSGGICSQGGLVQGVSAPGGLVLRGGIPACTEADPPPPPWTESQTPVKTLPWPNFVAAGKYALPRITYSLACCTTYKIKLLPKFQLEFSW